MATVSRRERGFFNSAQQSQRTPLKIGARLLCRFALSALISRYDRSSPPALISSTSPLLDPFCAWLLQQPNETLEKRSRSVGNSRNPPSVNAPTRLEIIIIIQREQRQTSSESRKNMQLNHFNCCHYHTKQP